MDQPTRHLDHNEAHPEPDRAIVELEDAAVGVQQCPKCQSPMDWAYMESGIGAVERVNNIVGTGFARPRAEPDSRDRPVFNRSACRVLFCVECGFVEFYVADPYALLKGT